MPTARERVRELLSVLVAPIGIAVAQLYARERKPGGSRSANQARPKHEQIRHCAERSSSPKPASPKADAVLGLLIVRNSPPARGPTLTQNADSARVVTVEKARQVACILPRYACQRLVLYAWQRRQKARAPEPGRRFQSFRRGRSRPRLLHVRRRTSRGSRRPRACARRRAQEKHRAAIACLCCRPLMRWRVPWFTGDQRPWCARAGCGRSRRSSGTPSAGGSRRWKGSGTAARRCPGCSRLG